MTRERKQKLLLAEFLKKQFGEGDFITEKDFPWGNITEDTKEKFKNIFDKLKAVRGYTEFAEPGKIKFDFVIESKKVIIEYDEKQHFSAQRKLTLESYPENVNLFFDKQKWIAKCEAVNAKDNDPPYRDEQRAFRDTVRDITTQENGYRLIRVMYGEDNYDFAKPEDLQKILELIG